MHATEAGWIKLNHCCIIVLVRDMLHKICHRKVVVKVTDACINAVHILDRIIVLLKNRHATSIWILSLVLAVTFVTRLFC